MYNGMPLSFEIPENIADFVGHHDGSSMEVSLNPAFTVSGYAHVIWLTVRVSMLNRRCIHCGYETLWNPKPEKPCPCRHTYAKITYDDVFTWRNTWDPENKEDYRSINTRAKTSLEKAFTIFLENQNPYGYEKIKAMHFDARKTYLTAEETEAIMERCPNLTCGCAIPRGIWKFCPQCGTKLEPEAPDD